MTLYIAEYTALAANHDSGAVAILPVPPIFSSALVTSATSSATPIPLQPSTQFIELCTDTTCSVLILPFAQVGAYTFTTQVGRLNANERIIRRVPCSPQSGGAVENPATDLRSASQPMDPACTSAATLLLILGEVASHPLFHIEH